MKEKRIIDNKKIIKQLYLNIFKNLALTLLFCYIFYFFLFLSASMFEDLELYTQFILVIFNIYRFIVMICPVWSLQILFIILTILAIKKVSKNYYINKESYNKISLALIIVFIIISFSVSFLKINTIRGEYSRDLSYYTILNTNYFYLESEDSDSFEHYIKYPDYGKYENSYISYDTNPDLIVEIITSKRDFYVNIFVISTIIINIINFIIIKLYMKKLILKTQ